MGGLRARRRGRSSSRDAVSGHSVWPRPGQAGPPLATAAATDKPVGRNVLGPASPPTPKETAMTKLVICLLLALALTATLAMVAPSTAREAADGPRIVHDVYFALKDSTPEARKKLVAACKKYLT